MAITLRPEHEQQFLDAVREGGFESADDAMETALEMLRSQNEWLLENRTLIASKIQRGIAELDRGAGIPENQLDSHLKRLKAEPE